ncbi:interleukin 15, like isoform X3 [Nothobranchius furzeri]|uniref:interleukin 15, like isoform X3 n=1 Tax=Nothobranchius furzeri TaxID=105023 RepID=UPI00240468B0|nr:interleukin 15, like isoform X3 [Nothobranchius furzeri]
MLRARSALATVFLWSLCLFAVGAARCSKDLVVRVQALRNTTLKQELLNSSLYTPSITYYQQKCPRVAFECFAEELNVLIKELEVNGQTVPRKEKVGPWLRRLACDFPDQQLACQCELLQEKNATEFLSGLLRTVEMMNTEFCNTVLSPPDRKCSQMGPAGQTGPLRCKNQHKCF